MSPKKASRQQLSMISHIGRARGTHSLDVALARDAVEIRQAGTVVAVERDAVWGPSGLPGRPVPGEERATDRDLDSRVPRCINYA